MRNDSSNDINHDLSKDFIKVSLIQNYKRTIKKLYLEACKMEKEKSLELEKKSGVYSELQKFTSLVLVAQSDLKKDIPDADCSIVKMALDAETFGSLEWVIQFVFCSDGSEYKRLISPHGATSFMKVYSMPVKIGGKVNG